MTGTQKHHATGRTEVTAYVPTRFDEPEDGPALVEVQLTETFTGDIEGEGTARVIQAARKRRVGDLRRHRARSRVARRPERHISASGQRHGRRQADARRMVRRPRLWHRGSHEPPRRRRLHRSARSARVHLARVFLRVTVTARDSPRENEESCELLASQRAARRLTSEHLTTALAARGRDALARVGRLGATRRCQLDARVGDEVLAVCGGGAAAGLCPGAPRLGQLGTVRLSTAGRCQRQDSGKQKQRSHRILRGDCWSTCATRRPAAGRAHHPEARQRESSMRPGGVTIAPQLLRPKHCRRPGRRTSPPGSSETGRSCGSVSAAEVGGRQLRAAAPPLESRET